MPGHSGVHRPRFDGVSRLLVSQDKRIIKCFVQTLETNTRKSGCCDLGKKSSSTSLRFVLLDLLSLCGFHDMESVLRARLVETLVQHSHYTYDYLGMNVHQAQRW